MQTYSKVHKSIKKYVKMCRKSLLGQFAAVKNLNSVQETDI